MLFSILFKRAASIYLRLRWLLECCSKVSLKPVTFVLGLSLIISGCSWVGFDKGRPELSKRVVEYGQPVPKGGGHYKIGQPYKINGVRYYPRKDPYYDEVGVASWYGAKFHGRYTANGEIYDMDALTAAHPTLPMPSYVRVTNLNNGRSLVVRVNDRGPYANDRIIDMSRRSAALLGFKRNGTARVRVKYIGRAPLNGNDSYERRYLAQQRWSRGARRRYSSVRQPRRYARARQRYDNITVGSLPRENRYRPQAYTEPRYSIQTGTFYNRGNARRQKAELSYFGRSYITSSYHNRRSMHRVLLGPYRSRHEAERVLSRISIYGVHDAVIIKK